MEDLELENVIEIEHIQRLLAPHPQLLELFQLLINISNTRINKEATCVDLPLEEHQDTILSDHESDDE